MDRSQHHILTVNVEDYFQVGAFRKLIPHSEWDRFEGRLRRGVHLALDLLESTGNRATFFVGGWLAERHADVVRMIVDAGHEVAAQGYYQHAITDLNPNEFRADLRHSRHIIEQASGQAVSGFRIGRGWINRNQRWARRILLEEGFRYDASACPLGVGVGAAECFLDAANISADSLVVVPISTHRWHGLTIPFAGGNYLRQLPRNFTRAATEHWLNTCEHPLVAYFHTWELDAQQPDITAAGLLARLRHYRNLDRVAGLLDELLRRASFTGVAEHLGIERREIVRTRRQDVDEAGSIAPPTVTGVATPQVALTIVVPCYNEQDSVAYLARTLQAFAAENAAALELHYRFVDDGSTDQTLTLLHQYFDDWTTARVVKMPHNTGIAGAVLAGVRESETDLVAVIDADCTFDPHQLPHMLAVLDESAVMVTSSPFHPEGRIDHVPWWRLGLSRGAALLYRLLLNNKLTNYTSCFRIYRREAITGMTLADTGFCGITEIIARLDLDGHRVVEAPATLQIRLLGESKIRLLNVTTSHLRLLWRILQARIAGRPLGG